MSTITIKPDQLAGALKRGHDNFIKAQYKACHAAALKLVGHLKRQTDHLGITDSGVYKNSFRAIKTTRGATVINEAPYAGIIEMGARPHSVSRAGVEAIAKWVRRKMLVASGPVQEHVSWHTGADGIPRAKVKRVKPHVSTELTDQALSIAYAIAHKIKLHGQKGHFVMRDALPQARAFYAQELARLSKAA